MAMRVNVGDRIGLFLLFGNDVQTGIALLHIRIVCCSSCFDEGVQPRVLVHLRTTVLRSTAEAPKVTLVRDRKRLEIRHLGFAACGSSIRQGAFAVPKSPDAPEPMQPTNQGGREFESLRARQ
jgi:hypothetical protein